MDCPETGCIHIGKLVELIIFERKIMPQSEWCQDIALVGVYIDRLMANAAEDERRLAEKQQQIEMKQDEIDELRKRNENLEWRLSRV